MSFRSWVGAWGDPQVLVVLVGAALSGAITVAVAKMNPVDPDRSHVEIAGNDSVVQRPPDTIPPPEVGPPLRGSDGLRSATFQHYIFSSEYNWVFRSSHAVELAGRLVPNGLAPHLATSGIQAQLRGARQGLIAVGTASEEGVLHPERRRARARAETLVSWLREATHSGNIHVPLYALGLGQYRCGSGEDAETYTQRRIILIAVLQAERGVDLGAALRDALESPSSPTRASCYSHFDFEPRT